MEHIHGLGVNPRDDALIIATHTGLFSAPRGSTRATRVGDRRQDTMGFTVTGPDEFVGSGHPDLRDDLPSALGFIRSVDGGDTWKPVSLLGRADFHVLRVRGARVYGFDGASGRLLTSGDGGRSWTRGAAVGNIIDLAIDPRDARHVVASTPRGLRESPDAGRTWRRLPADAPGLLLWTDALRFIGGDGVVMVSKDAGRSWLSVGSVGAQPVAATADGADLYVATNRNAVLVSADGGQTWRVRASAS